MDIQKLLDTIEKGVQFVEKLTPVLSEIPGAGPIVATAVQAASAVTEVVTNIVDRVDEGKIVMGTDDQEVLKGYISRLQAVNDQLANYIDTH